jgi:hypothetical protein
VDRGREEIHRAQQSIAIAMNEAGAIYMTVRKSKVAIYLSPFIRVFISAGSEALTKGRKRSPSCKCVGVHAPDTWCWKSRGK